MAALRAHLKRMEQLRLEGQKPIPRMDVWSHIQSQSELHNGLNDYEIDTQSTGPFARPFARSLAPH